MQLSKPPKPKATRKRLKKEILSDDFKKRKIFWKMFHLTSHCEHCAGIWTQYNKCVGLENVGQKRTSLQFAWYTTDMRR
jgi:hypothetical protein